MSKKRILVTGGAGFIGSHIVGDNLALGHDVWAVDNLQAGRLSNLENFNHHPNFRFDQADLRNWSKLEEAVKWADRIYHMAGNVGQRLILSNPVDTLKNNIHGCECVLDAMSTSKSQARLLIASTSELYCHSLEDEDGTVCETAVMDLFSGQFLQESYPVSKLVNEVMALSYAFQKGLDCTVARIFNTVGVNQRSIYGMVVPTFVEQALSGKPITIFGDGNQSRSFSNVHDTVKAFDLLLDNPKSKGEVVNVGDDRECSINNLARIVLEKTGSKSPTKYLTYKEAYGVEHFDDVMRRRPNLKKLQSFTGFRPSCDIAQTVEQIIEAATVKH